MNMNNSNVVELPDYDEVKIKVARLMNILGKAENPDALASALEKVGVKGYVNHVRACPIANCVRKAIGTQEFTGTPECLVMVRVSVVGVQARRKDRPPNGEWAGQWDEVELRMPPVVKEFIQLFDEGRYPSLVK